jgi:alkylation response protein AidB-like acyl-CoA dehydrogenase
MNAVLSAPPEACPATPAATAMEAALAPVQEVIRQLLAPQVAKIDTDALYPHDVMRALGQAGAYRGAVSPDHGGNGLGLSHVIAAMTAVSRECVSTGFLVWCQTACANRVTTP